MLINVILIVLIFLFSLLICGRIWKFLSDFHHKNYSYFDFIFLTTYFIEQFLFLLLYNLDIRHRELWVGLIVLFVITTASSDKFMMNSRQRRSTRVIRKSLDERNKLSSFIEKQKNVIKIQEKIMNLQNKLIKSYLKK